MGLERLHVEVRDEVDNAHGSGHKLQPNVVSPHIYIYIHTYIYIYTHIFIYTNIYIYIYIDWYPVLRTTQITFHFIPNRPVHSITNSTSPGSIQPHCNYYTDCSFTYPPLLIVRYSFIQLSELWQKNCLSFETVGRGFEPGYSRLRVQRSDQYSTAPH